MKKVKIKQFVEDHKKAVIGTVVGVGGVALCTAAYRIGVNKGIYTEGVGWMAMINADKDRTAMLAESWLGDAVDDKSIIALGNELLRTVSK